MIAIRPTDRAVVEARWEATRAQARKALSPQSSPPRPTNVRAILDLGTLTYYTFRGKMYGVPPLPWRQGELLLDTWLELQSYGDNITKANIKKYYACIGKLANLIWKNTRVIGRVPRVLKRLHLFKNPFEKANDMELAEIAVFYLGRRMAKTGGFRTDEAPRQLTS